MTRIFTAIALCGCALSATAQTQRGYSLFADPGKRFSVEFPRDWRWSMVSPAGEALATFVQPDGEAAVIVERFRMKQRLAPEDITDIFAQIEVEYIREGQPRATDIKPRIAPQKGGPIIVIEYTRPGVNDKVRERVRQYSVPVGQNLYRITCAARLDTFPRYDSTFTTIAETLKPAVGP